MTGAGTPLSPPVVTSERVSTKPAVGKRDWFDKLTLLAAIAGVLLVVYTTVTSQIKDTKTATDTLDALNGLKTLAASSVDQAKAANLQAAQATAQAKAVHDQFGEMEKQSKIAQQQAAAAQKTATAAAHQLEEARLHNRLSVKPSVRFYREGDDSQAAIGLCHIRHSADPEGRTGRPSGECQTNGPRETMRDALMKLHWLLAVAAPAVLMSGCAYDPVYDAQMTAHWHLADNSNLLEPGMPADQVLTVMKTPPDSTSLQTCGSSTPDPWQCKVYKYDGGGKTLWIYLMYSQTVGGWIVNNWTIV